MYCLAKPKIRSPRFIIGCFILALSYTVFFLYGNLIDTGLNVIVQRSIAKTEATNLKKFTQSLRPLQSEIPFLQNITSEWEKSLLSKSSSSIFAIIKDWKTAVLNSSLSPLPRSELNISTKSIDMKQKNLHQSFSSSSTGISSFTSLSSKTFTQSHRLNHQNASVSSKSRALVPNPRSIPQGKRNFSIQYIQILRSLDLIDPSGRFDEATIFDNYPVFVSAWSTNHHFQGIETLFRSLHNYKELPANRKKLVVYDLGLKSKEVAEIKSLGDMVQYRQFNFSMYPSYVQNRMQYRWKPLIIAEALLEFPTIWWLDAHISIYNKNNSSLLLLRNSIKNNRKHLAFGIFNYTGHSIFAATHPGMFDFVPMSTEKAKNLTMVDASHMLWFGTRKMKSELLKWLVWCALEEDCMAPPGAHRMCDFKPNQYEFYGQCHRYDQSALSIILALLTKYDTERYLLNGKLSPLKYQI